MPYISLANVAVCLVNVHATCLGGGSNTSYGRFQYFTARVSAFYRGHLLKNLLTGNLLHRHSGRIHCRLDGREGMGYGIREPGPGF